MTQRRQVEAAADSPDRASPRQGSALPSHHRYALLTAVAPRYVLRRIGVNPPRRARSQAPAAASAPGGCDHAAPLRPGWTWLLLINPMAVAISEDTSVM